MEKLKIENKDLQEKFGAAVNLFNDNLLNMEDPELEVKRMEFEVYKTWKRFIITQSKGQNNSVFCCKCYAFMNRGRKKLHINQNHLVLPYKDIQIFKDFLDLLVNNSLCYKNTNGYLLTAKIGAEEGFLNRKKKGPGLIPSIKKEIKREDFQSSQPAPNYQANNYQQVAFQQPSNIQNFHQEVTSHQEWQPFFPQPLYPVYQQPTLQNQQYAYLNQPAPLLQAHSYPQGNQPAYFNQPAPLLSYPQGNHPGFFNQQAPLLQAHSYPQGNLPVYFNQPAPLLQVHSYPQGNQDNNLADRFTIPPNQPQATYQQPASLPINNNPPQVSFYPEANINHNIADRSEIPQQEKIKNTIKKEEQEEFKGNEVPPGMIRRNWVNYIVEKSSSLKLDDSENNFGFKSVRDSLRKIEKENKLASMENSSSDSEEDSAEEYVARRLDLVTDNKELSKLDTQRSSDSEKPVEMTKEAKNLPVYDSGEDNEEGKRKPISKKMKPVAKSPMKLRPKLRSHKSNE